MSSKLRDSFANLARAQIKMWTTPVSFEEEVICTVEATEDLQHQKAEEAASKEESAYQKSIRTNATVDEDENDTALALDEVLQKGRLKRSKILSTIHNTISSDLNNSKEQLDVIHNREKGLLDTDKPNLFYDIMIALTNDCGADYTI